MGNIQRKAWPALVVLVVVWLALSLYVPHAYAQESTLRATIQAALLSDPRSQDLSPEDLDSLVEMLVAEAEGEGITASDITWRPEEPEPEIVETINTCGNLPVFLCMLNESLGFSSGNLMIPVLLFLGSAALLFVLGLMVKMHRNKMTPEIGGMQ